VIGQQQGQQIDPSLSDANRDVPVRTAVIATDIPCDTCGYNLRSLAPDALCPECRAPVSASLVQTTADGIPTSRTERRWATFVIVGIVGMLLLYPQILWVELFMDFNEAAFGNAPKLNIIGPKVWAMALVQRSIGRGVESLGGQGTWLPLMNVTALWLITARHGASEALSSRSNILRLFARWLPAILVGGFLGFMMNVEGTYFTDIALSKYAMIGVAGVELPGSVLLLAYLSHVASKLGKVGLSRRFLLALLGTVVAQGAAIWMAIIAEDLGPSRHELHIQLWAAAYQALCVVVGLFTAGCMVELALTLVPRAVPTAWRSLLK
jgi:hypothetical protein